MFALGSTDGGQQALLAAVDRFAHEQQLAPSIRFRLGLIIDEVVTNSLSHGACNPCTVPISVTIHNREQDLLIEITDTGPPFNPGTHSLPVTPSPQKIMPGGMGLCLVRKLASSITYTREEPYNHLQISLTKQVQDLPCR